MRTPCLAIGLVFFILMFCVASSSVASEPVRPSQNVTAEKTIKAEPQDDPRGIAELDPGEEKSTSPVTDLNSLFNPSPMMSCHPGCCPGNCSLCSSDADCMKKCQTEDGVSGFGGSCMGGICYCLC